MKKRFDELLRSTSIEGIEELITALEEGGFYTSPASSGHHLAKDGGLLEHSLNVYDVAIKFMSEKAFYTKVETRDLIVACLLHDVGKMGAFGKPNYEENILKSGQRSTSKPFTTTGLSLQHQDVSLMTVSKYIDLTEKQAMAIKYHNGLYTADGRDIKGKETPLYLIVHFADMWASRVTEA